MHGATQVTAYSAPRPQLHNCHVDAAVPLKRRPVTTSLDDVVTALQRFMNIDSLSNKETSHPIWADNDGSIPTRISHNNELPSALQLKSNFRRNECQHEDSNYCSLFR
jgi:hypothetical protein